MPWQSIDVMIFAKRCWVTMMYYAIKWLYCTYMPVEGCWQTRMCILITLIFSCLERRLCPQIVVEPHLKPLPPVKRWPCIARAMFLRAGNETLPRHLKMFSQWRAQWNRPISGDQCPADLFRLS